jgi:hypothetical protein
MAKMLHLLLDWEYPHWMMMAGASLWRPGLSVLHFIETGTLKPIRKNWGAKRTHSNSRTLKIHPLSWRFDAAAAHVTLARYQED